MGRWGGPQLAFGDGMGVSLRLTWKPKETPPWRDSLLTLLPGDLSSLCSVQAVKPLAFQMEKAGLEGLSMLPGME